MTRAIDPEETEMSLGAILLIVAVAVLVVGWLLLTFREPLKRRDSADYRHQHTENPDYFPGHGGQGAGGGGG